MSSRQIHHPTKKCHSSGLTPHRQYSSRSITEAIVCATHLANPFQISKER
jgi:hypothetical protein